MFLRSVLSLILPFKGFQHVIKQGRGGRLLNTQNVELKTPLDPHVNRSAQSLREPRDLGFQRVTVSWVPGLRPCMEPPARSSQSLMEPREGSEQFFWSWEPTVFDRDPQPLITPSDRGLLPTTPSRRPGIVTPLSSCFVADAGDMLQAYHLRPVGSLDDELGHHDEDDHDDYDDHDYIDDGETDTSDPIWKPRSLVRSLILSFQSRMF